MDRLLDFKHDMKNTIKGQLLHMQGKKQNLKEHLVGLQYNMEDCKTKFGKANTNVQAFEASILISKKV